MKNFKEYLNDYMTEANGKTYELYHNTSSEAIQTVYDDLIKQGYEVDEDEWFQQVSGTRKPSPGKTNSYKIGLTKSGKPVKKMAVFQVYNRDNKDRTIKNPYELNFYLS